MSKLRTILKIKQSIPNNTRVNLNTQYTNANGVTKTWECVYKEYGVLWIDIIDDSPLGNYATRAENLDDDELLDILHHIRINKNILK